MGKNIMFLVLLFSPWYYTMKMYDIFNLEMLLPPDICYKDYILSLKKFKAIINEKDLEKQEEFTREFGQEG